MSERVEYRVRGASGTIWTRWMNDDADARLRVEMAECAECYDDAPFRVVRVTTTTHEVDVTPTEEPTK